MTRYRMTPARRAALRKAQTASARKRRGHGGGKKKMSRKRKAVYAGIAVGAALAYRKSPAARNAVKYPYKRTKLGAKRTRASYKQVRPNKRRKR